MLLSCRCPTKFWYSTGCADEIQIENKTILSTTTSASAKPHAKTHCHHGDDVNGIQRSKLYLPIESEKKIIVVGYACVVRRASSKSMQK